MQDETSPVFGDDDVPPIADRADSDVVVPSPDVVADDASSDCVASVASDASDCVASDASEELDFDWSALSAPGLLEGSMIRFEDYNSGYHNHTQRVDEDEIKSSSCSPPGVCSNARPAGLRNMSAISPAHSGVISDPEGWGEEGRVRG